MKCVCAVHVWEMRNSRFRGTPSHSITCLQEQAELVNGSLQDASLGFHQDTPNEPSRPRQCLHHTAHEPRAPWCCVVDYDDQIIRVKVPLRIVPFASLLHDREILNQHAGWISVHTNDVCRDLLFDLGII